MLKAIHGITPYLILLYQWKIKAFDDFLNCESLNKKQEPYLLPVTIRPCARNRARKL